MPVVLGCCPHPPRCLLCGPAPEVPPELVAALVEATARDKGPPTEVRFFGGPPPTAAQLAAAGDLPKAVRVRPDLLSRAEADALVAAGVHAVELDVLSFHDPAVRAVGRAHRAALVREMVEGLRALGLHVGGVLTPGLPGTDHATALADAHAAAIFDHVRLHPVLVLADAGLRELHERGRYVPLTLGEAVTVCRDMLDVLEGHGVEVVRIGLQPGPDGLGRAVAGPSHPSLRELVEARRTLDGLRELLGETAAGQHVVVRCAPADETRTRGERNQHVRTLRAEFRLASLRILPDPALPRGTHRLEHAVPQESA